MKSRLISIFNNTTNQISHSAREKASSTRNERNTSKNDRGLTTNPFANQRPRDKIEGKINQVMQNPLTQMGIDYTSGKINSLMEENKALIPSYIFSERVKQFFDLEQVVIWQKFKFILFPFNFRSQSEEYGEENELFVTKAEFYLPSMALISFVLISCFHMILNETEFDATNITNDVTRCLILSLCETVLTKLVFLIAVSVSIPFIDIMAFSCYKYIG